MNARSLAGRVEVVADQDGLTSRAGTALLAGVADRVGLTGALGAAMSGVRERASRHCPGRALRDVAVMLADGGDALCDVRVLRDEPSLFGAVASDATAWRAIVALLVMGPGGGSVRGLHKLSFIVLFAAMGVHVLAHLRKVPALTAADWRKRTRLAGGSARRALLLASPLAGLGFGAVAVAYDGAWVHRAHHHRFEDGGR